MEARIEAGLESGRDHASKVNVRKSALVSDNPTWLASKAPIEHAQLVFEDFARLVKVVRERLGKTEESISNKLDSRAHLIGGKGQPLFNFDFLHGSGAHQSGAVGANLRKILADCE